MGSSGLTLTYLEFIKMDIVIRHRSFLGLISQLMDPYVLHLICIVWSSEDLVRWHASSI